MDSRQNRTSPLPEDAMPAGLHERIMRTVLFRHYARVSFPLLLLLAGNVILSGWRVWTKLAEADFLSVVSALRESFELSTGFLTDAAGTILSVLPIYALLIFCINMAIVLYLIKVGNIFAQSYEPI